jgi:glycosyltransferase involved in cell wall biosynthesis
MARINSGEGMRILWVVANQQTAELVALGDALRQQVSLDILPLQLGLAQLRQVGQLLRTDADIVHVFGSVSPYLLRVIKWWKPRIHLVQSGGDPSNSAHFIAFEPSDVEHAKHQLPAERITVLPFSFQPLTLNQLPQVGRRLIVSVSLAQKEPGRLAIWAFDVLRHTDPTLQLVIHGQGEARPWLEGFAKSLAWDDLRVTITDSPLSLHSSDLAWSLSPVGGTAFALQAASLGIPMLAIPNPDLQSLQTYCPELQFSESADPVSLAKHTLERLRTGHTALRRSELVVEFSIQKMASALLSVYNKLPR